MFIAPRIFHLATRWKRLVSLRPRPLYPLRKSPKHPLTSRLVASSRRKKAWPSGNRQTSRSPWPWTTNMCSDITADLFTSSFAMRLTFSPQPTKSLRLNTNTSSSFSHNYRRYSCSDLLVLTTVQSKRIICSVTKRLHTLIADSTTNQELILHCLRKIVALKWYSKRQV